MTCYQLLDILMALMVHLALAETSESLMLPDALSGFGVSPLSWTGPVKDGGQNYTFEGTAEVYLFYPIVHAALC